MFFFLNKSLCRHFPGYRMQPLVGNIIEPIFTFKSDVIKIIIRPSGQKISFDIVNGFFYLAFFMGLTNITNNRRTIIESDKIQIMGVKDDLLLHSAADHTLQIVINDGFWDTANKMKRMNMSS